MNYIKRQSGLHGRNSSDRMCKVGWLTGTLHGLCGWSVVVWKEALHFAVTELCYKLLFSDPSGQKAVQPLYTEVYTILQWWMQHVCDPMPFPPPNPLPPIHPSHQPPLTEHRLCTLQEFSGSVSNWGVLVWISQHSEPCSVHPSCKLLLAVWLVSPNAEAEGESL